jgi:hypothetical protein
LPLRLLERRVKEWVEEASREPAPPVPATRPS